jgi:hypothetical protein
MQLLSLHNVFRSDSHPLANPLLTAALELLWRASRYAADLGVDAWEFAVEMGELRRAHITHSELRWLLSRGYAEHAYETTAKNGRRRFGRLTTGSLSDNSCFVISDAGKGLVESLTSEAWTGNNQQPLILAWPNANELKSSVGHTLFMKEKPSWDAQRRELWIDGRLLKRFRRPSSNQQLILDSFESSGWPKLVVDPLPLQPAQCPKRRLHDAIKCLNRYHHHQLLRFSGDGSGRGVLWERIG